MLVNPVMFLPGRAKLAMSPAPTASATAAKTKGIVLVACLAAREAGVVGVTIGRELGQLPYPPACEGVEFWRGPGRAVEQETGPWDLPRLLCLGSERRGEEAACYGAEKGSALNH